MTEITFYHDENDKFTGFTALGHAGFKKSGSDIVCAAISTLTITFVNSVERLTDTEVNVKSDEKTGFLNVMIKEYNKPDIQLLFNSLRLGLNAIQEDYSKYLKLTNRRCKP